LYDENGEWNTVKVKVKVKQCPSHILKWWQWHPTNIYHCEAMILVTKHYKTYTTDNDMQKELFRIY